MPAQAGGRKLAPRTAAPDHSIGPVGEGCAWADGSGGGSARIDLPHPVPYDRKWPRVLACDGLSYPSLPAAVCHPETLSDAVSRFGRYRLNRAEASGGMR